MEYVCAGLVLLVLFLLTKLFTISIYNQQILTNLNLIKMTLADFQPILDSINASTTSIADYVSSVNGGLTAADANALKDSLAVVANSLSTIVPAQSAA